MSSDRTHHSSSVEGHSVNWLRVTYGYTQRSVHLSDLIREVSFVQYMMMNTETPPQLASMQRIRERRILCAKWRLYITLPPLKAQGWWQKKGWKDTKSLSWWMVTRVTSKLWTQPGSSIYELTVAYTSILLYTHDPIRLKPDKISMDTGSGMESQL